MPGWLHARRGRKWCAGSEWANSKHGQNRDESGQAGRAADVTQPPCGQREAADPPKGSCSTRFPAETDYSLLLWYILLDINSVG